MAAEAVPSKNRHLTRRILAILFVVGISIAIFLVRDQVETLKVYGYPGVFFFTLLTSATVILPAPGLIVVFSLGGILNPALVGLAAAIGATLGELSGYLAGYSGRVVVEDTANYQKIRGWMKNHIRLSSWLIMVLAFVPLPFMDMAGMAAGALRMSVWRFIGWCFAGKLPKMLLVAWLGTLSIEWIEKLFFQ